MRRTLGLAVGATLVGDVLGQTCTTTTLQSNTPTSGNVVFKAFSYCGGTLNSSVYIKNLAYNKIVTLFYTDSNGQTSPLTSVGLGYDSSIANTDYELWTSSTPVWYDGIQQLLNITYNVVDLGETYNQSLNKKVTASGAAPPKLAAPPKPYATPKGFGDDITRFLSVSPDSQLRRSFTKMFVNINPNIEGAADGIVVAGRSGPSFASKDPDYEYDWVRDSSLTMEVVQMLYDAATKAKPKTQYQNALFKYAAGRATEQNDPNLQTGLGEPKFYLNNTIFEKPWGRPQNDGPATAAITLMEFANSYLAKGGNIATVKQKLYDSTKYPTVAPIKKDLLFVASNWTSSSFDLWEEESSDHFYTRMVQRKALVLGTAFAKKMGDSSTASTLQSAANTLSGTMNQFWNKGRQILLYEYGPVLRGKSSYLDAAIPLGLIHGYANDGLFSYTNDQVQATMVRYTTSFIEQYSIFNTTKPEGYGLTLGIPIGRYPEDVYNGTGTQPNGGNPWYLTTAAVAQYFWTASAEYQSAGSLTATSTSKPFFDYFAPDSGVQVGRKYAKNSREFQAVISSLNGWGDAFMRTVKHFTPSDGSLAEEFNRNTGVPQGCVDLTWSYASILTASFQRAKLRQQKAYVKQLANLGYQEN